MTWPTPKRFLAPLSLITLGVCVLAFRHSVRSDDMQFPVGQERPARAEEERPPNQRINQRKKKLVSDMQLYESRSEAWLFVEVSSYAPHIGSGTQWKPDSFHIFVIDQAGIVSECSMRAHLMRSASGHFFSTR